MPISFGGINTGLPPNLVDQLVEAERIPIKNLESNKAKHELKLELVNDLEARLNGLLGSLGSLASTKGFNDMKLVSGDPNIIAGAVDPEAAANGSYMVEVKKLAEKAAALTNGFPDKDRTEVGIGYFKFETPNGDKEVYIGEENNTLEGAADAINAADLGVRASVINDRKDPDYPYKLMISGVGVGGDAAVEYPTLYFLDGDQDLYFDEERPATNGVVSVDGFEFEITDNSVEDIIPGVTLELRQEAPGRKVNISVNEDKEVVSGKIKEFVDAMNQVLSFIQAQNRMDANTDTSKTLGGDSLVRSVESRMRRLIQGRQVGVAGPIKRLSQLGIEYNRSGTLNFNQEKFNSVLASNPEAVQSFFAGDGFNVGFIPTLKKSVTNVVNQAFGPVGIRKRALQEKIRRVDDRISDKERQLVRKEQRLRQKFARLEETMSRLKSQGGALGAVGGQAVGGFNLKQG